MPSMIVSRLCRASIVWQIATILLAPALLFPALLVGQATGRITGTVVDAGDALVAGASVQCRNTESGLLSATVTNQEGIFRFPDLPIGTYEITVTQPGFQTLVRGSIDLLTAHTVDLRLQLQVGAVTQSVNVTTEIAPLQSASSEVQTTIDSRSMRELPLNGRNPLELVVLTPGADFTDTDTVVGQQDNTGITVNGLRATYNNYQLDGAGFNNPHFGSAPTLPNPDTLQEFTVQSSNFSARESRAGAVVQLSTRSGSNQYHGSVFEFLRNDKLNARNFFSLRRSTFKRNQFGATMGGPVIKDKLLFFGSYQGTITRGGPNPKQLTVPDQALRTGDFSALSGRIIVDPLTATRFPGDRIPSNRFDPISLKLLDLTPLPNREGYSAVVERDDGQDDHQIMGKLDYEVASRNHLSGRYFFDRNHIRRDFGSVPGIYCENHYRNEILTIRDTHTFGPSLTAIASLSYSRTHRLEVPVTPIFMQDLTDKVPLGTTRAKPEIRLTVSGYFSVSTGGPLTFDPRMWEGRGQFAWSHGGHLVQFGVDMHRSLEIAADDTQRSGFWTFGAIRTRSDSIRGSVGDAFASFLLGLPSSFVQGGSYPVEIVETKYQPWIQDDWKVRRNLTLNLGLRWEPWLAARDRVAQMTGFVRGLQSVVAPDAPTGLVFSGDPNIPDEIFSRDWNNLAPRVGFAWDIKGRTVIRGGYGIYFQSPVLNVQRLTQATFRKLSVTINTPPTTADPYAAVGGSPFPFVPPSRDAVKTYKFTKPLTAEALDPSARTSYTQTWNLTVERQLPGRISGSLSYVANHSVKILSGLQGNPAIYRPGATASDVDARRIFPGMAALDLYSAWGSGYHHSMQLNAVRRTRRGASIMANWVFSKTIDYGSAWNFAGGAPRDPFDLRSGKGPANYDAAHRVNVVLLYDLPNIAHSRLAGGFLNGWQLNTIFTAATGLPFTVTAGSDRSLIGANKDNADVVGDPARPTGVDEVVKWFNTTAFAVPPLGTFGTSGRNNMRGPGRQVVNLSLFKNLTVIERVRLQLRAEGFNVFNRANFANPSSAVNSVNCGRILTARDPRVIQFGAKLLF